jgi:hypothetical protein
MRHSAPHAWCFNLNLMYAVDQVLDEIPVGGGILQGKTFEQLIEEQLKLESQKPVS